MSRDTSLAARMALNAQETGEAFLILLTLSHPAMQEPLRVTSDAVETQSRGESFAPFPFELTLPDDDGNGAPQARLAIDNVDRQIVRALRELGSAPFVLMEIVRAADPDTVEARFVDFRLTDITYDSRVVEGILGIEDFTSEPYPANVFSPGLFPGLF